MLSEGETIAESKWSAIDPNSHNCRAKFDAYKSLGRMSKERAMELYVEELKKIIETMSYTDNVAEFMGSISELDGVELEDLQAVAPDAIKKVRSQPNSPFGNHQSMLLRSLCVAYETLVF